MSENNDQYAKLAEECAVAIAEIRKTTGADLFGRAAEGEILTRVVEPLVRELEEARRGRIISDSIRTAEKRILIAEIEKNTTVTAERDGLKAEVAKTALLAAESNRSLEYLRAQLAASREECEQFRLQGAGYIGDIVNLRTALVDARKVGERVERLLAENKQLNAEPTGNHYFPETREGWDAVHNQPKE